MSRNRIDNDIPTHPSLQPLVETPPTVRRKPVDFEAIWNKQGISPAFEVALGIAADAVHDVIMNPGKGSHNIQEWTKQPNCWEETKRLRPSWNTDWISELLDLSTERQLRDEARKDQIELNSIDAQTKVVEMGGVFGPMCLSGRKPTTQSPTGRQATCVRQRASHKARFRKIGSARS